MASYDVRDIRNRHIKEIISAVRFSDHITRREVAEVCGLSFPTVSNLCNELIAAGVLSETDIPVSRVGRTPKGLVLNYDRFYSICVDLQFKGNLGFAIFDLRNNVVFERCYDISDKKSLAEIIAFVDVLFNEQKNALDIPVERFCGLGISVSAIYDTFDNKLVNSAIGMFENEKVKLITSQYFDFPVYIDNESNLCALSVSQAGRGLKNVVYLHISEGVGVGIMVKGQLLRGKNGHAGEVAHVPIGDLAIKCPTCNNNGCVEAELRVSGLVNSVPHLRELPGGASHKWGLFVEYLNSPAGQALAQEKAVLLGKLGSILVNIFDPEVLYIGGHIADVYDLMEERFINEIELRCPLATAREMKIVVDANSAFTRYKGISETIYEKWVPLADRFAGERVDS